MDHHLVVTFHYQQQEVFAKIVKFYSRHIPRQLQRLIEFVVLCAAISSLCLLLYAHTVVKHLPKRCVDATVAQNPALFVDFDVLRVDFARDVPLDYSLNDSYAKEFSLFGFYNSLFDTDRSESIDEESYSARVHQKLDEEYVDLAVGPSPDSNGHVPSQEDARGGGEVVDGEFTSSENEDSSGTASRADQLRIHLRDYEKQTSTAHFDERHPTDSLFANLCSSLYLMVTGGLVRGATLRPGSHSRARSTSQSQSNAKSANAASEPLASANFIRQLARHFPPAAFAVVGSDALFASANTDRFVVEFSRELGFLKLSADVRNRLGLQTALWYFAEPVGPLQEHQVFAAPLVDRQSASTAAQGNESATRCEVNTSTRANKYMEMRPKPLLPVKSNTIRFDNGICFGSQFDRILFDYTFGYDDYLIGIVKRYAELLNITHGYVRNVMNGEYYRYRTGGTLRGGLRGASRWETVLRSAAAMCGFTWLVSTLLRHSHEQIFALIVALLRHLETNWTLVLPASPLFVIVLGLLGAQVLLATVFRTDSPTAFFLLVAVWFADHFYALVSTGLPPHAGTARIYFARFFYAYQLAFYVHYALESGLFAGLALVTYALFLLHAAIYLFHHHHLPLARAARARARRFRRTDHRRRLSQEPVITGSAIPLVEGSAEFLLDNAANTAGLDTNAVEAENDRTSVAAPPRNIDVSSLGQG